MTLLKDCCGYFIDNTLYVTGIFNSAYNDYSSKINGIPINEFNFNANTNMDISKFKEADCLTFDFTNLRQSMDSNRTYYCNIENIKIKKDVDPDHPAHKFWKPTQNLIENTKKETVHKKTVSLKKTFTESFPNDEINLFSRETENIDLLFFPSLKDIYLKYAKNNNIINVFNIEPDWIHYEDYTKHGLTEIWDNAFENPDRDYYLVFNNINITITRIGLLPLFDVLNGNRPQLPNTEHSGIPQNIHLLATIIDKDTPYNLCNPIDISLFSSWKLYNPNTNEIEDSHIALEEFFKKCGTV